MHDKSWSGAEVRFLDYDEVLHDLRQAVAEAKRAHPEIIKVMLFGSLAQGNWTADSDTDLMVVVKRTFPDVLGSRVPYPIYCRSIPTDSLVYSEDEFRDMCHDPESFLSRNLPTAIEL